jgi:hypothetical protein
MKAPSRLGFNSLSAATSILHAFPDRLHRLAELEDPGSSGQRRPGDVEREEL